MPYSRDPSVLLAVAVCWPLLLAEPAGGALKPCRHIRRLLVVVGCRFARVVNVRFRLLSQFRWWRRMLAAL
jgi:hypothetical protein